MAIVVRDKDRRKKEEKTREWGERSKWGERTFKWTDMFQG
jgi:hypothetical protein